jgi:hypothetical protein
MPGPSTKWPLGRARRQGAQMARPGSAVEAFQGHAFGGLQPQIARSLRIPLDPSIPQQDLPSQIANIPINWTSQTFNSAAFENIVPAYPNRVVLIVQNLSPTLPIAVNFDQTASVTGTTPNYVSQGIMLLPGVSLFIDRWCPTGTVHISATNAPTNVTQGFSAIGNIPEANG